MSFDIFLCDNMTGRIMVKCHAGTAENLPGSWELTVDGKRVSSGRFFAGTFAPGEEKEFLLGD